MDLGHDELDRETEDKGTNAPEDTADRGSDKGTKGAPVVAIESLLEEQKLTSLLSVAVVDEAKEEDGKDATETTDDNLEATPPVAALDETDAEDGDGGGRDEIGDEVDLKNRGGLEGEDDDGDDDEDDAASDEPDVEPVAEQVVGGGRDHGGLQTVESSCAQGDDHDEDDANDPAGKTFQESKEGDGPRRGNLIALQSSRPDGDETGGADEGEDAQDDDGGDDGAEVEILVRLGGKGAQPEGGQEEAVCQDGDGQDVQELPAEEVGLEEARGLDEAAVDGGLCADGDGGEDDEADDHGTLDDVGQEGDAEATESWGGV